MTPAERKGVLIWFARRDEQTQAEIAADAKARARRMDNNDRKSGRPVDQGKSLLDALLKSIQAAKAAENFMSTRQGDVLESEMQRAERAVRKEREQARETRKSAARKFLESHRRMILGMHDRKFSIREIQGVLERQKKTRVSIGIIHRMLVAWIEDREREIASRSLEE